MVFPSISSHGNLLTLNVFYVERCSLAAILRLVEGKTSVSGNSLIFSCCHTMTKKTWWGHANSALCMFSDMKERSPQEPTGLNTRPWSELEIHWSVQWAALPCTYSQGNIWELMKPHSMSWRGKGIGTWILFWALLLVSLLQNEVFCTVNVLV